MGLDLTVLRLLKYRDRYERLAGAIPAQALDPKLAILIADFGAYFREFPEAKRVEFGPFWLWWAGFRHPTMPSEARAVFQALLPQVEQDVEPAIETGLMARLVAAAAAHDTAKLIEQFNAGEDVDLRAGLARIKDRFDAEFVKKAKNPQILDAIEDLLQAEKDDRGLHFRLGVLNRHIKPLVGGDFVVIAARPDKGKTTLLSSELTYMAPQVDILYPDEKRSILWLNNEGPGKRIITRNFQAAIGEHGSTIEELVALNVPSDDPTSKYKTKIREAYVQALGGRPGVLRVFDIHGFNSMEVEDLIRQYNPAIIVFDMVDNIRFGGEVGNNGQRTDQLLEAMYQWARMLAVKYDAVALATSQISADGDGLQWPTLSMLKDSKTGKQGAADLIITVGTVNDISLVNSRYIGVTKSKKVRTGMPASPNVEVIFKGDRARYEEAPQ